MGTILSAAEFGKAVILMPRLAKFNEHRNDHQQDTAKEMSRLSNVTVVSDGEALHGALDEANSSGFDVPRTAMTSEADELASLIDAIRDFVWAGESSVPLQRALFRRSGA